MPEGPAGLSRPFAQSSLVIAHIINVVPTRLDEDTLEKISNSVFTDVKITTHNTDFSVNIVLEAGNFKSIEALEEMSENTKSVLDDKDIEVINTRIRAN